MKRTKVITISGKAGSGKDYTAKILNDIITEKYGQSVLITHFADLLKYFSKTFYGWDGKKDEVGRTLLQYVGTEVVRSKNPNYWVDFIGDMLELIDEWDVVLIPDTRFQNEITRLQERFYLDVYTVNVIRPNLETKLTESQLKHSSENSLNDFEFDYILENNDLETLKKDCELLIDSIFNLKKESNSLNSKIDTIYIDIDGTVVNTNKAITDLYNEDYAFYSDFKPIDWRTINTWEYSELTLARPENINLYFNQKRFFNRLEFFKDAKKVIDTLHTKYKYRIVFVTMGYSPNLRIKEKLFKQVFPYCEFIGVNFKEHSDKSHIDMRNGIFIDDSNKNHETSNATYKICYGDITLYNKDFDTSKDNHYRAYSWFEVDNIIKSIHKTDCIGDNIISFLQYKNDKK